MKHDSHTIQSKTAEQNIGNRRVIFTALIVIILSLVLLFRLFQLQIVRHEKYATNADTNRIEYITIAPTRGLIYDRNGNIIADNFPVFDLTINKEKIENTDATLAYLKTRLGFSDKQIERFRKKLKQPHRLGQAIILKTSLSESQVAKIESDRFMHPEIQIKARLVRNYPYADRLAHALGGVRRIDQRDLTRIDNGLYKGTTHIGKIGVEKFYEYELFGEPGLLKVERDARNRVVQTLERIPPKAGENLELYLDVNMQSIAFEGIQEYSASGRASVVAIEIETGGILTMLSTPSYDPNIFVGDRVLAKLFTPLNESKDKPFLNRATDGIYPPASTIKPFLGIAGIETGAITWDTEIDDPGRFKIENYKKVYNDWTWKYRKDGHGHNVDLVQAIVESCDTFFYQLAYDMGIEDLHSYLAKFGFGQNMSLDVNRPRSGTNPTSEWKKSKTGYSWFAGDSVNLGIGQGFLEASPLQIATATAVLGNRGKWVRPRLLKSSTDPLLPYDDGTGQSDIILQDPDDWEKMFKSMESVVYESSPLEGTARYMKDKTKYRIGGKTGTAQVKGIAEDEEYDSETTKEIWRDHIWFIALAPINDPKIAVAVLIENSKKGESGGKNAAPIANSLIEHYLDDYYKKHPNEVPMMNASFNPNLTQVQP
jgi:penicillin-binding protein 2